MCVCERECDITGGKMVDPSVIKCLRKCEDGRSASLFSSATSDRSILGTET